MPGGYPDPVFLDTTVVSNFASTESIEFLVSILESPVVVPAVRDEIEQGRQFGHDYLDSAVEAFGDGLRVSDVSPETEDEPFRERLDAGEADALRGALSAWTHHYNLAVCFAESRRRAELCAYLLLVRHSLQRRRERI